MYRRIIDAFVVPSTDTKGLCVYSIAHNGATRPSRTNFSMIYIWVHPIEDQWLRPSRVCMCVCDGRRVKAGLGKRRKAEEEGRRAVAKWEGSLRSKGADADELARIEERKALAKLEALLKVIQTERAVFFQGLLHYSVYIFMEGGRESGTEVPPWSQEGREGAQ